MSDGTREIQLLDKDTVIMSGIWKAPAHRMITNLKDVAECSIGPPKDAVNGGRLRSMTGLDAA